jgi:hypothetical protein
MGRLNRDQGQLFYCFNLDEVVPEDHLVRAIAAVLDLSWVHGIYSYSVSAFIVRNDLRVRARTSPLGTGAQRRVHSCQDLAFTTPLMMLKAASALSPSQYMSVPLVKRVMDAMMARRARSPSAAQSVSEKDTNPILTRRLASRCRCKVKEAIKNYRCGSRLFLTQVG